MWRKGRVMSLEARLCGVSPNQSFGRLDPRAESEKALAVMDLLENNSFLPVGHDGGPYRLRIEAADGRLVLHIADDDGAHVVSHHLSITPFRRPLKDYARICDSYCDAIRRPGPEEVDMGRRGVHNEDTELVTHFCSSPLNKFCQAEAQAAAPSSQRGTLRERNTFS